MSHFYDSHLVYGSFIKRYFFFHLVKNEEGCMPFLLVRKHNFPNQVAMVYFHPYRNSKCPNLDSALPYYRPSHYLHSILHQCACTAQSTQANSQILKRTNCSSNPPCFSHSPELSPFPGDSFVKNHSRDHPGDLSLSPSVLPQPLVCASTGKYHFLVNWLLIHLHH